MGFPRHALHALRALLDTLRIAARTTVESAVLAAQILYPRTCCACGVEFDGSGEVCGVCAPTFVILGARGCAKCGGEAVMLLRTRRRPSRCARCRGRRFAFTAAVAGLRYREAVRDLILAVKFHERPEGLVPLVDPLCRAVRARGFHRRVECVVSVPLHPLRRFFRGFDQAELLARALARELALPYHQGVLRRRVFRRPQSLAPRTERFANLERGFAPGRRARAVRGLRVLLVDDVLTSGATADAASRALRAAGARAIYVAVAAS